MAKIKRKKMGRENEMRREKKRRRRWPQTTYAQGTEVKQFNNSITQIDNDFYFMCSILTQTKSIYAHTYFRMIRLHCSM